MKIDGDDYSIDYDSASGITRFSGSLRLNGTEEYAPIASFLGETRAAGDTGPTWDLTGLEFLNSSGINMMYKFIIGLRKEPDVSMTVIGSSSIAWQAKSLANMKKFLPTLELDIQ